MLAFSTISELVAEAKALHEVDGEGWHKIWYQYMGFHLMLLLFMVTWGFVWLLVPFFCWTLQKAVNVFNFSSSHFDTYFHSCQLLCEKHFGMNDESFQRDDRNFGIYDINYWCWNCVSEEHWVSSKVWL